MNWIDRSIYNKCNRISTEQRVFNALLNMEKNYTKTPVVITDDGFYKALACSVIAFVVRAATYKCT